VLLFEDVYTGPEVKFKIGDGAVEGFENDQKET
jgi:hypothetical protein